MRKTPLTTFLFGFKITSGPLAADYQGGTAFFKSVGGIKSDNEVTDYTEGGVTAWTRKVIGVRKWPNIVLKNGFTGDGRLFKWKYAPKRVNGTIYQLGPNMKEMCRWEFVNGYPVKWEGPDFDAFKNEIAIETIEIAHEGLEFKVGAPPPPVQAAPPPPPAPPAPEPPPPKATVKFGTDGSTVTDSPELKAIADWLKKDPQNKVTIDAHTDSEGSASYNQTLSQKRADAVKEYYKKQGLEAQVQSATGHGEAECLAALGDNKNSAAHRRTDVNPVPK
jgi:phage tail-like protein